ncbi:MAG: alpha/beta-type small acid-soluble spore protein [Clostridia bacterium]|nr:alpha/beta-type small acid-soluble spore protein [Clostridia bacterium]
MNQNGGSAASSQNGSTNNSSSNRVNVPEARQALDNMKYEIAGELGINLKQGYNGDLPSRQAGSIGGYMVKRMIEQQEKQMSGQQN